MEIDCPYTTLWITAQDNDWDHFYVHAAAEHPKDGAEWVGFFRDSHGMEGFLRGMQTANDKMLAELSHTKDENAKLRAELANCDVKLEEAIDMLVNLYDLRNLNDEWMGKVAMILAKNDK